MYKSILLVFAIVFILSSCTEVVFESPQPQGVKSLKEIPSSLHGNYSFVVLNEQQAMHITKKYFEGKDGKEYLSDSLIIKKIGNKFVINKLNTGGGSAEGKWSVFIFEEKGCGFLKTTSFVISEDEYIDEFVELYKAIPIGDGKEKQLIIDPTKKQFEELSENKKAMLTVILEKIE